MLEGDNVTQTIKAITERTSKCRVLARATDQSRLFDSGVTALGAVSESYNCFH